MTIPSALYIHVPLCKSKCAYCDFFSVATMPENLQSRLVDSTLERANELTARFGAESYRTLYVGGGTPTALSPRLLRRLLEGLASLAREAEEWTVEANPESLSPDVLETLLRAGVTRLSLGVQSLDEGTLSRLGRPHDAARAEAALKLAVASGLMVSADLLAAVPRSRGEKVARGRSLAEEVARLMELGVGHLSVYDLVVEEGTRIASALARGELETLGEDEAWEERQAAETVLAQAGFRRYEVSNYAPAGAECLHNLAYWMMDSYVGAGPGAVSTIADGECSLRIEETRDLAGYSEYAAERAHEERIASTDSAFEMIMMGFRTRFGLDLESFQRRFGREVEEVLPASLSAWSARLTPGWGGGRRLAMDDRGLDLLNRFLAECLAELETTYPAEMASEYKGA